MIPMSVVRAEGPWTVPLEFNVYYSQANRWTPSVDEMTNPHVPEGNFIGPGWSHTLSEAIVVTEMLTANGNTTELRVPPSRLGVQWNSILPTAGYPGHLQMTGDAPPQPFRRIYYRLPWGEMHEFFTVGGNSIGTDQCALYDDAYLRMANHRGSPYRLEILRDGVNTTFRVFDLASGVRSDFDSLGRIVSKKAPTPNGGRFGWTVTYSGAGAPFAAITHDSGARIVHNSVGGWLGSLHLLGVVDPPGTLGNSSNEWARFNDPRFMNGVPYHARANSGRLAIAK